MFRICGRLPTAENNRFSTAESSFLYSFVFVFGPSHSRSQAERYLWNRVACSDTKKICVCLWFILFYVSTQCFHACWHVYLIHISHAHSAWLKTSSKPRSVKRECSSHFLSAGVCIGFQGSLKGESYLTPPHPTPLHSIPPHPTPPHSTPLHSTPLHFTSLHFTSLTSLTLRSLTHTHHTHITHSHSQSLTIHEHTYIHTNSPTITAPSLLYFLFPSCFSMISLSKEVGNMWGYPVL